MTKPFNTLRKKMSLPARKAAQEKMIIKKLTRLIHKRKNWTINGRMWRNLFKTFGIKFAKCLHNNRMLKIEDFYENDSMAPIHSPSERSHTDMYESFL